MSDRGFAGLAIALAGAAVTVLVIFDVCIIKEVREVHAQTASSEIPTIVDSPTEGESVDSGSDGLTVLPQADGPFYDAPLDIEQTTVCDRENRLYILLRSPEGGLAITPYLDEEGNQKVADRP